MARNSSRASCSVITPMRFVFGSSVRRTPSPTKLAQPLSIFTVPASAPVSAAAVFKSGVSWSRKLVWLNLMLWGGSFLLAIEHIRHGEVVPWPPFLTAMNSPAGIQPMLMEILTVGGTMVLFVTAAWFVMTLAADRICRRSDVPAAVEN